MKEIVYPSEEFLRAMYWNIVAVARYDFELDATYAIAIAQAASTVRK